MKCCTPWGYLCKLPQGAKKFFAEMLANLGVPWVILGDSERRALLSETNEVHFPLQGFNPSMLLNSHLFIVMIVPGLCKSGHSVVLVQFVGEKVGYALSQGLKVIACVGETLEQREAGTTMEVVAALENVSKTINYCTLLPLCNEIILPVWAIGTGKVASLAQVQEVSVSVISLTFDYSDINLCIRVCMCNTVLGVASQKQFLNLGCNSFLVVVTSVQYLHKSVVLMGDGVVYNVDAKTKDKPSLEFQATNRPHVCLAKLAKINGPIMLFKLGQITTLVISSADTAKVLQKQILAFLSRHFLDVLHVRH
ncbi:Triosephosphate isomerase, cytosolic [Artemisia annua]|uniref:Triosephosphate isomerase, cytosolic n=1 Tax=Artemisia annua TaxID=35608 RepID=A0A2U1NDA7_ARTAN|nr:Triosephosphate isomerase, cytosolic [Artemisia annua]